jgi:hypothetical protein
MKKLAKEESIYTSYSNWQNRHKRKRLGRPGIMIYRLHTGYIPTRPVPATKIADLQASRAGTGRKKTSLNFAAAAAETTVAISENVSEGQLVVV